MPRDAVSTAPPSRVVDSLLAAPHRWEFFVVVGMLERLTPAAARVGGDGPFGRESIRFRHDESLAFSAGEVTALQRVPIPRPPEAALEEKRHRYEVTTSFLGLTGVVSPLPTYLPEEMLSDDEGTEIRRDFLDVFHHRLVSFVYRVGVKFDYPREYQSTADDEWSNRVLALAGMDAYQGWRLRHLERWRILRLAPLLAAGTRSARTLQVAVADVLGEHLGEAQVRLVQFCGGWTPLDPEQRMSLGVLNNRLGSDAVLGIQCFDRAGKARLVIGPLGDNFRRLLADGDLYPVLCELLGIMLPEPIDIELELVLAAQARPPFQLSEPMGARLGFDAWLSSRSGATQPTHVRVPLPRDLSRPVEAKATAHAHSPSQSAG